MAFILLVDEVFILGEEIGRNHRYEKGDEKARDAAELSACLACRNKGEQKAGGICLHIGEYRLQGLGQPLGKGIALRPEVRKPGFHQADIVRQVFRKFFQLCHNACSTPKAEQPQKRKQQQYADEGTDAAGDMKFLQTVCQWVEQKAQQPTNQKRQKNSKEIAEE